MPSGIPGSVRMYNCVQCGGLAKHGHSKTNKFCSITCQQSYKWIHETRPRIESGTSRHDSSTLKKYLIEEHGENCSICNLGNSWNNKKLVLQLDHIDGDSDNNYPSNLRLLCPNCHTQTDNYGSKGHGSRYKKNTKRNSYLREYKGG